MSSSSDDDAPLVNNKANGAKSADHISKSVDRAMDKGNPSSSRVMPGVSIRTGPVKEMDVDKPETNGHANGTVNGKRKARSSATNRKSYKETSASEDEDDVPLTKRRRTAPAKPGSLSSSELSDVPLAKTTLKKPPKAAAHDIGEESDSDVPLGQKLAKEKANIERRAEKEAKAIRAEEKKTTTTKQKSKKAKDDSDDEALARKRKTPAKKKANGVKKDESDDDDIPLRKKAPVNKTKAKSGPTTPAKKGKKA
ncbi:DNA topoisomerase 1, partial [Cryomyces antarcticus]